MDKEYLKEMARLLEAKLPDNHGFILFAMPFGDNPDNRLSYIASINRADAINVLREWLIKASGEEEWMKHLK